MISSGTFTTTSAATTHTASVSGLPAPRTSRAAKLPIESTTRAAATSPRMTPARGFPSRSTQQRAARSHDLTLATSGGLGGPGTGAP